MPQQLTKGAKEAHEEEDDDTPDNIFVDETLNFTSLVAGTSVVKQGLCVMTYNYTISYIKINIK